MSRERALTTAIRNRLLHKAHVRDINGRSDRLSDLEQTLETVRS